MKPEDVKCPECDGPMVSRTNSKNNTKFWGCKNYPNCKGTRDSMGMSKLDREMEREDNAQKEPEERFSWEKDNK